MINICARIQFKNNRRKKNKIISESNELFFETLKLIVLSLAGSSRSRKNCVCYKSVRADDQKCLWNFLSNNNQKVLSIEFYVEVFFSFAVYSFVSVSKVTQAPPFALKVNHIFVQSNLIKFYDVIEIYVSDWIKKTIHTF